jgi:diguanylate cyclase (GGDEF)-like protein
VLVSLALMLGKNSRSSDLPCRYGGDEFLVLLVGMDGPAGAEAAERLRATVEAATVESGADHISVTISIGVACVPAGQRMELPDLIGRADRALYMAKQRGRNRVVVI